jgi:endonuclease/exonuclease/phosphatase family metal-dependent hydrolase
VAQRSTVDGAVVPAAAFVALLGWDGMRVWLPGVLFIAGDAGTTSATTLGAIALGTVLAPVVVVIASRSSHGAGGWLAAVGAIAAGRLALQVFAGGTALFAAATVVVLGTGFALAALAAHARSPAAVRLGVLIGVSASTAMHALFGTVDLAWRSGGFALAASAVLAGALVVAAVRARASLEGARPDAPAWPWWMLGPSLLLFGVLVAPPGRIAVAVGWSDARVAVTAVVLAGLPVLGAVVSRRFSPRVSTPTGAAMVLVGTAGALRAGSLAAVGAQVLLALGIGICVGTMATTSSSSPRRRAAAGAGALVTLAVVGFAYYAPYDLPLPYPPRAALLLAAASLAAASLAVAISHAAEPIRERGVTSRAFVVIAAVTATAVLAALLTPRTDLVTVAPDHDGTPIRVVLYNIRMGFDPDGALSIEALADTIADLQPDVVVLNEVDRGWLTTGGRDTLRIVRRRLGMPYQFGPAADEVWGNAVLSRFPVSDVRVERLSRGRDAMARSQLTVLIEIAPDVSIAVVGTHLSHVDVQGDTRLPQARTVAANVARLRDRGVPVILAGDLNAEPGSAELATFGELVRSALDEGLPTYPAWAPTAQIDHVLVSDDLQVVSAARIGRRHSDHLGLVVDVLPDRVVPGS